MASHVVEILQGTLCKLEAFTSEVFCMTVPGAALFQAACDTVCVEESLRVPSFSMFAPGLRKLFNASSTVGCSFNLDADPASLC